MKISDELAKARAEALEMNRKHNITDVYLQYDACVVCNLIQKRHFFCQHSYYFYCQVCYDRKMCKVSKHNYALQKLRKGISA